MTFDTNGLSPPVSFVIPEKTRSVTIVVEGDRSRLYALASFAMADGVDRVGIDLEAPPAAAMKRSYFDEQAGGMPGSLYQSIRLGTFTHVYPYAPAQSLVPGAATLRVAADGVSGSAKVTIMMPEDDGSKKLHLNVVRVSESATLSAPLSFLDALRALFAPAGLDVVIDEVMTLPGTGYATITTSTEPQETPDSEAARLAAIAGPKTKSAALDLMIVDALPPGIAGLSLGVPGPPVPGSHYFGVVVAAGGGDTTFARVVAHEVAHFLGLQHVQNKGASGKVYDDPLDDTNPTTSNLMTNGKALTPGQIFVLQRSALLSK
ncbi:MAG: hypothetical protein JST00_06660 [Deltaproteobacteria bacterium]|nr:hypothetical protein [Deltaproteobacteria bacterium]